MFEKMNYTMEEFKKVGAILKEFFDHVRIVDPSECCVYGIDEEGKLAAEETPCYRIWDFNRRCDNCISNCVVHSHQKESKIEFQNGQECFVLSKYICIDGEDYVVEMVSKVTMREAPEKAVNMLDYNDKLYHDELTGAYNRWFSKEYRNIIKRSDAVVYIDMDHLKKINDTYGHIWGDRAIKKVAEIIMQNIRESDILVRDGGDEFCLILKGIACEAMEKKLEKIRREISKVRFPECEGLKLSVSMGADASGASFEEKKENADAMMYVAKKMRNCIKIYS